MSHADHADGSRRDFLYFATAGAATVATGAAVWPLVNQMNPTADVVALSSIQVDVSGVARNTQLTVLWQGKPVFIRHRSDEEIAEGEAVAVADLIDPGAENANLNPEARATDANRAMAGKPEWLVMIGICTHLGCVPLGDRAGDYDGWFCPCHGSQYDSAGRVRRGPAPKNLAVPVASFIDDNTLKLG